MDDLCLAKQNLFDCLGSNFKWFVDCPSSIPSLRCDFIFCVCGILNAKFYLSHFCSPFFSYLSLLRSWFRNHISKEEFDYEARKLFNNSNISKHNAFLLALFSRCQDLSSLDSQSGKNLYFSQLFR